MGLNENMEQELQNRIGEISPELKAWIAELVKEEATKLMENMEQERKDRIAEAESLAESMEQASKAAIAEEAAKLIDNMEQARKDRIAEASTEQERNTNQAIKGLTISKPQAIKGLPTPEQERGMNKAIKGLPE